MGQLQVYKALIGSLALIAALAAEAAMKQDVTFESQNQTLVGNLFLPDDYQAGDKLPAVVVTGAWTTVKEQMATTYAKGLADKGYAALVFDFRGWGGSDGGTKFLEDPQRKSADIDAAIDYLVTRPEVDGGKVAGLGICASAGYMSDVAASNNNIKSLALVAPWLHDKAIVETVYGGEDGVQKLLAIAEEAERGSEPVYIEAASLSNENALMYQAPYYTEADRGLIPEYDNQFNVASWKGWLTYDALQTADIQSKPSLLVHSDAAAIPEGAKAYVARAASRAASNVALMMLENVTQFDFYDQPQAVSVATNAVVEHFNKTLK